MRIALAITPYFTNGDSPPLGLTYISTVLREAGHDVNCYDLIHFTLRDYEPFFAHFRRLVNLGIVGRRVTFLLNPEFTLFALYQDAFRDVKHLLPENLSIKSGWVAGAMMLKQLSIRWASMILEHDPEIIMLSTYSSNLFSTLPLALELKKKTSAPIILGGPGVGLVEIYQLVLATGIVDGIVVGEGERTVVELAQAIRKNRVISSCPYVDGVVSTNSPLTPRAQIMNLDDLPAPIFDGLPAYGLNLKDYEALSENPYKSPFFVGLPVMASRGCANRCSYCSESAFWNKWRIRNPQALANEIKLLKEKTGRDVFLFCDSALNLNPFWLSDFCEKVIPLNIRFLSYMVVHPDLDENLARKMYKAGWRGAIVGVETFSDRLRKLVHKNSSRVDAMNTIRALARANIWVKANILCGFPTETEDDVNETIRAIEKLNSESDVKRRLWWDAGHPLRLEPYSLMFNKPDKYNIKIVPYFLELPPRLSAIQPFVDRITLKWDPGFSEEVVEQRSKRLIEISANPLE